MRTDFVDIKSVLKRKIAEGKAASDLLKMVETWEEENLPEYDENGKFAIPQPSLHMLFATLLDPEYLGTSGTSYALRGCQRTEREPQSNG